jgi:hypothetical protein
MSLGFCVLSFHAVSEWPPLLARLIQRGSVCWWMAVYAAVASRTRVFAKTFCGHRAADIVRQALAQVHCDFYYVVLVQWSPQCEVLECAFVSLRLQDHRGRSVLGSHVEAEVL